MKRSPKKGGPQAMYGFRLPLMPNRCRVESDIQPINGSVMTSNERASAVKNDRKARPAPMLTAQRHPACLASRSLYKQQGSTCVYRTMQLRRRPFQNLYGLMYACTMRTQGWQKSQLHEQVLNASAVWQKCCAHHKSHSHKAISTGSAMWWRTLAAHRQTAPLPLVARAAAQ